MQLSAQTAGATAESFDELRELMEEPTGGENHGRAADPENPGQHLPLSVSGSQQRELLQEGGWSIVDAAHEGARAGGSSHRGVLHPHEHVDLDAVRAAAFDRLGFTPEEVRSVYDRGAAGGPLPGHLRDLRRRIDMRLFALSRTGSNMELLARLIGFTGPDGRWPDALTRAIARAKAEAVGS